MKLGSGRFYGNTISRLSVAGFSFAETSYVPNSVIPKHAHECAYFCFVLRGEYIECDGGHARQCKPSSLLFHPPEATHADRFGASGGSCFNIQIDAALLSKISEITAIPSRPVQFSSVALPNLAARLYREFYMGGSASALVIEGLALQILGESFRGSTGQRIRGRQYWINQVKELIDANFCQKLKLNAIAATVGVHPVHLARAFHQSLGCTVGEYVRERRIEFASHELSLSDAPLVEIATAAGFCSQSHFSTQFKRHTGFTPAEYRAMSRVR